MANLNSGPLGNVPGSNGKRRRTSSGPVTDLLLPILPARVNRPTGGGTSRSSSSNAIPKGISFGKGPVTQTRQGTAGSEWTKLLKQTVSTGLTSGLSSVVGLGGINGIGSIISGIASLFGSSKKASAPLADFKLPASETQTAYVGHGGMTVYQGTAEQGTVARQWIQDNNAQIAQAVKTALLHSSSLADVISEV